MSFSAGIVAAVGVSCAAGAFLISLGTGLWCVRRARRVRDAQQEDLQQRLEARGLTRILDLILPDPCVISLKAYSMHEKLLLKLGSLLGHEDGPFPSFNNDVLEAMTAAAGPSELWARLPDMSSIERNWALQHLIARVLYPRMRTDGDVATTLLPTGMLEAYQGIMTMPEDKLADRRPLAKRLAPPSTFRGKQAALRLRNYWRTITAAWSSEIHRLPGFPYPELRIPTFVERDMMAEDDKRIPNMVATEELLIRLLDPFTHNSLFLSEEDSPEDISADKFGLQSPQARKQLRRLTTIAADLALLCFSQTDITEVFWPDSGRPEVKGMLPGRLARAHNVCFGVRQMIEGEGNTMPEVRVFAEPRDSDAWARELRQLFTLDVLNESATGMKNSKYPNAALDQVTVEIQENLGWIKEGEPGLRERPPHARRPRM